MPADTEYPDQPTPHLSDAYQRARRNLVLASGILLAWEYVGVVVGDKGTTAELQAPAVKTPITLLNPEVLPDIVLILVIYFVFRLAIEWLQCDLIRRRQPACRADFFLSLALAILAITLFVIQTISNIRVADIISKITPLYFFWGVVSSIGIILLGILIKHWINLLHRADNIWHVLAYFVPDFIIFSIIHGLASAMVSYYTDNYLYGRSWFVGSIAIQVLYFVFVIFGNGLDIMRHRSRNNK